MFEFKILQKLEQNPKMLEIIKTEMKVKDNLVRVMRVGNIDYISLTDLAKYQNEENKKAIKIYEQFVLKVKSIAYSMQI